MEAVADVYLELDTLRIDEIYQSIGRNIYLIDSLGIADNKDLIYNYGALNKGFKEFVKVRPYTIEELNFCRQQLNDLSEDVENGLIDDDFRLFLTHEANASQSIRVQMSYYHERINAFIEKYENLNPDIEQLIDSLLYQK